MAVGNTYEASSEEDEWSELGNGLPGNANFEQHF